MEVGGSAALMDVAGIIPKLFSADVHSGLQVLQRLRVPASDSLTTPLQKNLTIICGKLLKAGYDLTYLTDQLDLVLPTDSAEYSTLYNAIRELDIWMSGEDLQAIAAHIDSAGRGKLYKDDLYAAIDFEAISK
jgi:hypothetical protein